MGSSTVRAAIVDPDGGLEHVHHEPVRPRTPAPGLVELDAEEVAAAALRVAATTLRAAGGPVAAVGVTNQRATTVLWDAASGQPVGPALGWQDLRTVGACLTLQADGFRVAPNQSATKLAHLLDEADPDRRRDLRFGTLDTWITWQLSGGALHVTDATNAAITGLLRTDGSGWWEDILAALRIPLSVLPSIVDSAGPVGAAGALAGAPLIAGLCGDQQASLIGQGCVAPGQAKITFGTGAMLDMCLGSRRPAFEIRGEHGCFPIIACRRGGVITWGAEAIMLSAGAAVDWLCQDLQLIDSPARSAEVAAEAVDSGGLYFVPALGGLGTPHWDFGAQGTLLGASRGAGRGALVRAVLEGVAHRAVDLLEAAEADTGWRSDTLRVDGGMTANGVFLQALADASGRSVEVSPILEATTAGAGYLAGLGVGIWENEEAVARCWRPAAVIEPQRQLDRGRWKDAVDRARGWIPELSAIAF